MALAELNDAGSGKMCEKSRLFWNAYRQGSNIIENNVQ